MRPDGTPQDDSPRPTEYLPAPTLERLRASAGRNNGMAARLLFRGDLQEIERAAVVAGDYVTAALAALALDWGRP